MVVGIFYGIEYFYNRMNRGYYAVHDTVTFTKEHRVWYGGPVGGPYMANSPEALELARKRYNEDWHELYKTGGL